MTTRYYEATAIVSPDHALQLTVPLEIPPGPVRVAIIFDADPVRQTEGQRIKDLLAGMPDVGDDADFARPRDLGREGPEWDS